MKTSRLIDTQYDYFNRIVAEYNKLGDIKRRRLLKTTQQLDIYEEQIKLIWSKIESIHKELTRANPDQQYIDQYETAQHNMEQLKRRIQVIRINPEIEFNDEDEDLPGEEEGAAKRSVEEAAGGAETAEETGFKAARDAEATEVPIEDSHTKGVAIAEVHPANGSAPTGAIPRNYNRNNAPPGTFAENAYVWPPHTRQANNTENSDSGRAPIHQLRSRQPSSSQNQRPETIAIAQDARQSQPYQQVADTRAARNFSTLPAAPQRSSQEQGSNSRAINRLPSSNRQLQQYQQFNDQPFLYPGEQANHYPEYFNPYPEYGANEQQFDSRQAQYPHQNFYALNPELQSEVNNLIKNIKLLRDIKIPRYFGTDQKNNLENNSDVYDVTSNVQFDIAQCASLEEAMSKTDHTDHSKALEALIQDHQSNEMKTLHKKLQDDKMAPKDHWTARLKPFIDEHGIIRLGGRLINAVSISYNQKHPIALNKGKLSQLIVKYTHETNMHANPKLTIQLINEKYWIPRCKSSVYQLVKNCTKCCKANAIALKPQMGNLPACRVNPSLPWTHTGMDLAGPMTVKASKLRYDRHIKVWVLVFTCMFTKATHLEIVNSISTEDLANAICRFLARRGPCHEFWSDNGTNFTGLAAVIKEQYQKSLQHCVQKFKPREIKWKFIPRWTPHMGGLWESRVKLLRAFLKRTESTTHFTPDQFETVLCNIELLLNSRPLHSLPENSDTLALTPMHLLLSKPAEQLPVDIDHAGKVLTRRFLEIQQVQKDMWKELQTFYFTELQRRTKWNSKQQNLKEGDIVMIKDPTRPPANWGIAKIHKTHPDKEGTVRIVDLTLQDKTIIENQAAARLVPLPGEPNLPENTNEPEKHDTSDKSTDGKKHLAQKKNNKMVKPRRSTRLQKMAIALLTILTIITPAIGQIVQPFTEGTHIIDLGTAYLHTGNIEFRVNTGINVTRDIEELETINKNYAQTCLKLNEVRNYCEQTHSIISRLIEKTIETIGNRFNARSKRSYWAAIGRGLWSVTKNVGIPAATGVGMVYQEARINELQQESEMVKTELRHVMKRQQATQQQTALIAYADNAKFIIDSFHDKYENIIHHHPIGKLLEFMEKNYPQVATPDLPNIFEYNMPKLTIIHHSLEIIYTIPTVERNTYDAKLLISVPDMSDNGTNFKYLLTRDNVTLTVTPLVANLYDQQKNTSTCITQLLRNETKACQHGKLSIKSLTLELMDKFIIINKHRNTSMMCHGDRTTINFTVFTITPENCSFEQSHNFIEVEVTLQDMENADINMTLPSTDDTFNDDSLPALTDRHYISFGSAIILLALIIAAVIKCACKYQKRRFDELKTRPEHITPKIIFLTDE
jgi:Family of unknown function (DUF5641)/Integrase zinc binding domain